MKPFNVSTQKQQEFETRMRRLGVKENDIEEKFIR
jgi:hypothetical protein